MLSLFRKPAAGKPAPPTAQTGLVLLDPAHKRIFEKHAAWLAKAPGGVRGDLSKMSFADTKWLAVDLSKAILRSSSWVGADLTETNLSGSKTGRPRASCS